MTEHPLIYDLDFETLQNTLIEWGEPAFRARQIWEGLYHSLWNQPEEFTNLPKSLRNRLAETFSFSHLTPVQTLESGDGETSKTLFQLPDSRSIETVLMRYKERRTLCISTQSGCAMGCVFCATGQMGFGRHLSSGEIVEQVVYFARQLKKIDEVVTNVVVMGMGEPFHNYDNTLKAIACLNHSEGFNLGARRFTISTVGLVPMIERFAQENHQINLAISLHAANDELRSSLLPINKKYPISVLMNAVRRYVAQTGRRVTFEWALIRDINDTPEHARELAQLLKGLLCHVNVIPLNPTQKYHGEATTRERAEIFCEILQKAGIPATIRLRRGIDIQAGCGQLATQHAQTSEG
ncbi:MULTISPECIES: 23S rRNA (adenine(2503)-C(2))-methyltransferase RlmN [Anaerolinea]|uniref:23S rRNA (adenine(2503)-C(2))-methyltransferase RlmN n=1 Tax=Anaerolinea TaxID=233189 RepID=UPI0026188B55|nr:23S rRNA (adenine(2503)-C(2))-methyltransferase RlmN [Anaerolinea thermophila]